MKNDIKNLANFHWNTWKCQRWYLHGIHLFKVYMCELKIYREVMCNDTEEWRKIWREIDLSFQNWHKEFDDFWLEHLKILKICILMGCFWPKHIIFKLKKYRGVIFHDTRDWCKIWRKTDLWLSNSSIKWGIWQLFTRALESPKIGISMGFFDLK